MNNLTKILNKQREKFDKQFPYHGFDEGGENEFHTQLIVKQNTLNTTELLEGVKKMLEEMKIVEFAYFGCNCCEHKMSCNPPQPNGGHNSALATAISNIEETLNINK